LPRPPRNYESEEYPLPHRFNSASAFDLGNEVLNSTILPLVRSRDDLNVADSVNVNPLHGAFGVETGPSCQEGSIVPHLNFRLSLSMSDYAINTDNLRSIRFLWFPFYISYKDNLTAINEEDAGTIETVLELANTLSGKFTKPLYTGTDLLTLSNLPMNTVEETEVFGNYGLTTDTKIESVAFDLQDFWDTLMFGTNKGMLKSSLGPIRWGRVYRDRPYSFASNNAMFPKVKRMNPYTFCGVMLHAEIAGLPGQDPWGADVTATNDALRFAYEVNFNEWNPNFDQTAA